MSFFGGGGSVNTPSSQSASTQPANQPGAAVVAFLISELAALAAEAKRKHPDIKESAERLQATLKSLKEKSSGYSGQANSDFIASELSKLDDVLRPFILSCESKNQKLVPVAISCFNRLVNIQGIPEASVALVIRSLSEHITGPMELQLKILQTILPLLTNYNVHGDAVADAMVLCFRLQDTKSPVVNNTAAATLRQLAVHMFEKVSKEDAKVESDTRNGITQNSQAMLPCARDAYLLFQDLCQLTSGEPSNFLKLSSIPKNLGLELVDSIISSHWKLFKSHSELLSLVKDKVCPIIIRLLKEKNEYSLATRLIRAMHIIIKHFNTILIMECEIFLSMFIKLLESENVPIWQRTLVIEATKGLFSTDGFIRSIHGTYDTQARNSKIFGELLAAVIKIFLSEKSGILVAGSVVGGAAESPGTATSFFPNEVWSISVQNSSMKMLCLDQLDKSEPPHIPDTYIIYLAIQCIVGVAESQAAFILPKLASGPEEAPTKESKDDIFLAIEMAKTSWPYILSSLSFLAVSMVDEDIFNMVMRAYQSFTAVLGLLGLVTHRDAFLASLCRICIPGSVQLTVDGAIAVKEISLLCKSTGQLFISRVMGGSAILSDRNVSCLRTLLNISTNLTDVLEDRAWYIVLETLQAADGLVSSGKMGRRESFAPPKDEVSAKSENRTHRISIIPQQQQQSNSNQPVYNALENQFVALLSLIKRMFESSKAMSDKSLKEFIKATCMLAKDGASGAHLLMNVPQTPSSSSMPHRLQDAQSKSTDEKSFAVARLYDICVLNSSRLVVLPMDGWDLIVYCLIDIIHSPTCVSSIRNQVCSIFGDIVAAAMQSADLISKSTSIRKEVEMRLLEPLKKLMLVDSSMVVPAAVPISTLDEVAVGESRIIKGPWFSDVQRAGLESLNKILQSCGQNLMFGWCLVFDVIRSVLNMGKGWKGVGSGMPGFGDGSLGETTHMTANTKTVALVRVAFPCLQLICTDFLGTLEPLVLFECIETLGCFGAQPEDVNISLTSIGLLWSVSDHVLTRRQQLEREGKLGIITETSHTTGNLSAANEIDSQIKRIKSAVIDENISTKTMDALWMHLLAHLSQLCSDSRPEVRNSANQTLFRTIGMNGKRLTLEAWDECIWMVLFPLMERVKISSERVELMGRLQSASAVSETLVTKTQPVLPIHHSRNTTSKQWDETKVLTLTGVTNSIINFFPVLVELGAGFDRAWSLFHDYIRSWCLGGSSEVATAAVKSLRNLVRYPRDLISPDGGPGKVAPNVEARFIDLCRVSWDVWESIGLGIISGADENVDRESSGDGRILNLNQRDLKLLHGPFSQDTLTVYISLFLDIYEVIQSTFGLFELKRLLSVVSCLLLYHSNPAPGATASKVKADNISDVENMTPLQDSVFSLVSGTKVNFDSIQGAPEAIMTIVAGFIKLPFLRMNSLTGIALSESKYQTPTGGMEKGFTYMALTKRSIQCLVTLFEQHGGLLTVYSGGTLEAMISALDIPMRAKYDCPSPGVKDSTPLWRVAANTAITIVEMSIVRLNSFVDELPQEVLNGIYNKILEMFDGFLLPSSVPPSILSVDELAVDTDFDISVFETFYSDVLLHMGQRHVPDHLILCLIKIISQCTKLYSTHLDDDCIRPSNAERASVLKRETSIHQNAMSRTQSKLENEKTAGHHQRETSTTPTVGRTNSLSGSPKLHNTNPTPTGKDIDENDANNWFSANGSHPRLSVTGDIQTGIKTFDHSYEDGKILGIDVVPLGREKFAKRCLECLLRLCSDDSQDQVDIRFRIATIAAPIILEKSRDIIRNYATDRPRNGKLPLPRIRNEEIVMVLEHLNNMKLRPNVLHKMMPDDKLHPLRGHILSGPSAHLFVLYPHICDLLAAVAKVGRMGGPSSSASGSEANEDHLIDLIRDCLSRVGKDLGIGDIEF